MGSSELVLVGDWIAFALDWDVFYFVLLFLVRYHGVRVVQLSVYCLGSSMAKGWCYGLC